MTTEFLESLSQTVFPRYPSFPINRRDGIQLTELERVLVHVLDVTLHQLEVVLIRLTPPKFAHIPVIRVQLYHILTVSR